MNFGLDSTAHFQQVFMTHLQKKLCHLSYHFVQFVRGSTYALHPRIRLSCPRILFLVDAVDHLSVAYINSILKNKVICYISTELLS